ncbi:MAG: hypothetical protein K8H86_01145 [Ignavibacteriaceae bacterium]|nr:hypothetical protein [Ignavibacteriaceae bacterium]
MMVKFKIPYFFLFIMFVSFTAFAQDMNSEAGKLFNEGNAKLKAGNYMGAVADYDKALKIEKDYRILYQKGVSLKKAGKLEEAKVTLEETVKANKDFEGGYNALGGVYFSLGDINAAIANFEKVLTLGINAKVKNAIKKNLSLAYTKLGTQQIKDGNSEKGIESLKKAVENNNYDAAFLALSKAYSENGKWDECIAAADNALKYRSGIGKGGPYYYMGVAYKNKGDNAKAEEMFNQAKADATYKKLAEYEFGSLK